ncbi:MAG: hypothetical protein ACLP9C_05560 [Acidimicrobiales bacterium]
MEKLVYVVWLPEGTARTDVREVMLGDVAPRLLRSDLVGLTMDLDDEDADVASPVPAPLGEHTPEAVVSMWVDAYDRRAPLEAVLGTVAQRVAGYQVLESMCCDYGQSRWAGPRTWPDGERSPGLLTVAMFEQRPDTDFEEWLAAWHGGVSTVSEQVQPRCRYVRNTVFRALTPGAPPYRGIVEEAWPSAEHVTDPMLFYCADGDPEQMDTNVTRLFEKVAVVLDLTTMRSITMSEWILRS